MKHERDLFSNIQVYSLSSLLFVNLQCVNVQSILVCLPTIKRFDIVENGNNNSQLLEHEEELIQTPF